MSVSESKDSNQTPPRPLFVTTQWSVVLAAKDKSSPECAQALETLCQAYWYPLYAFVRSSGYSPPDAQDLTQGFFAQLLAKDFLRLVEPEKGRFRTFLKMALKRFLAHEWERVRAEKRGGGQVCLSFDTAMAEELFQGDRTDTLDPDQIYDRRWALTLLGEVLSRLDSDHSGAVKATELALLKLYLTSERGSIPYAQIAATLQTTEGAARVALHRLRRRFRQLFREVISETVSMPSEVEEELRYVISVLSRG
ncbi:RNA polymerase, sigma-24 subunit, ECF subfamily [Verrucomicrobia bacterium]|nr:RNA polymerase, sigma-24 subunit, ECF subfamily [Verrucomicrobiota bacterium]